MPFYIGFTYEFLLLSPAFLITHPMFFIWELNCSSKLSNSIGSFSSFSFSASCPSSDSKSFRIAVPVNFLSKASFFGRSAGSRKLYFSFWLKGSIVLFWRTCLLSSITWCVSLNSFRTSSRFSNYGTWLPSYWRPMSLKWVMRFIVPSSWSESSRDTWPMIFSELNSITFYACLDDRMF